MHRLLVVGLAAAAAFGLTGSARATVVQGAVGKGIIQPQAGPAGEFSFDVRKVTAVVGRREVTRVEGILKFVSIDRVNRVAIEITMPNARQLAVGPDGRVAEFGGPAIMVVRGKNGVERFEGPLIVRAADLATPESAGAIPDNLRLEFRAGRTGRTFEYGGPVVRGDIRVFRRTGS